MSEKLAILLLDDEPLILLDLEIAAEDCGCEVFAAISVANALKFIDGAKRIDVAVLDVNLGNGQTCKPIAQRLDSLGVPYLLHSGDLNRKDEMVHELGVRHIPKPASSRYVIDAALASINS